MAAIAHASRVNTTNQTTTSATYVDATNGDIASGNFTTGDQYLLLAMAQLGVNNSFQAGYIQAVHGSTAFADSEQLLAGTQSTRRTPYFWWTVWTAVSGEDFHIQYRGNSAQAPTVSLDFIVLIAINLSDDVTENTDWAYAERATDDALTTTPLAGASITFTPSSASDWLVLTNGQYAMSADTISYISKMERSGEASSSLPEARREMIAAGMPTRFNVVSLARVFSLGAASNAFAEYGAESAVEVTRLHSRVFALNLDKFRNHAFGYTEADVSLSATNYATLLQTLSITPDVTGDVWVAGYFGFDVGNVARIVERGGPNHRDSRISGTSALL